MMKIVKNKYLVMRALKEKYNPEDAVSWTATTRELAKATGIMIQYTFTRTVGPPLDAIGSNEDYQNFAATGQVEGLNDDVPNASIENYSVTETRIASIGPHGELIPA